MTAADLPPAIEIVQPIAINNSCVIGAAAYYNIPPDLIVAVRIQEAGTVGRVSQNRNQSVDMGPMQINSIHLQEFERFGISAKDLISDECSNIFAGGYRLRVELGRASGDFWRGVGNYHSATPEKHYRYRRAVAERLRKLYINYAAYVMYLRAAAVDKRREYVTRGIVKE